MSINLAEIKAGNGITEAKVVECFEKLCKNSQTENQTTELKLAQEKAREVLKQCGIENNLDQLLSFSSCDDGKVLLTTIVSVLRVSRSYFGTP